MPLQCNIDARGKRVRLMIGVAVAVIGIGLIVAGLLKAITALWVIGVACLLSGGFMVFEARAGWCALRAMGLRTPI